MGAEGSIASISVFAGMIGGILGWLFRSSLDIFYIRYRDRRNVEIAIRRDISSIKKTYELLHQDEFITALASGDVNKARIVGQLAVVRSSNVQGDSLSAYGSTLFFLKESKLRVVLDTYRQIYASRIIFDKLALLYEARKHEDACALAKSAKPLFDATRNSVDELLAVV